MKKVNYFFRFMLAALSLATALLFAPPQASAQESVVIPCPVDEITAGFTTPRPEDLQNLRQLGRLTGAQLRQRENGVELTCLYQTDGEELAIVRPPPEGVMMCRIRASTPGFVCDPGATPEIPDDLRGKICQASIQNQIEWNYQGNKRWARANLARICKNADMSLQPGVCFDRVMHGGISHGKGTRWRWPHALRLCASTLNSQATIACFNQAIEAATPWPQAIDLCRAKSQ